jgi:hypothetical protein
MSFLDEISTIIKTRYFIDFRVWSGILLTRRLLNLELARKSAYTLQ